VPGGLRPPHGLQAWIRQRPRDGRDLDQPGPGSAAGVRPHREGPRAREPGAPGLRAATIRRTGRGRRADWNDPAPRHRRCAGWNDLAPERRRHAGL